MSIRCPIVLTSLALLVTMVGPPRAHAEQNRGLVLESHVGKRPRDADYLLSPLLDELKRHGFPGSSVAGTRIHSKHSVSPAQLTQKQIDSVKRDVKDARAAFINFRFQGTIQTGTRAVNVLMSSPATMARQQQVRDHLYHALIIISMANSRLGKEDDLAESMGEFIRSFPDRDVSVPDYGPEGAELYRQISKRMSTQEKGELQIAAGSGSMIFVNERYVGIGSLKLDLFPGQYRIFTQNGSRAGRVHLVDVEPERKQTLVVDEVVDKSLRTSNGFVGLVFTDEEERTKQERRVTMDLGSAIGANTIILVGFHKFKGRDTIVASSLSIETGETGLSARVPLPKNGAPSAAQLRSLAAFVAGSKPASPGIEVFTVNSSVVRNRPAGKSANKVIEDSQLTETRHDAGISATWRWSSWGLGAVGLGVGSYLLSIDGDGSCTLQPGQMTCPESYDTFAPALASLCAGTAFAVLGFYLWAKEDSTSHTKLSVLPAQGGFSAAVSGRF